MRDVIIGQALGIIATVLTFASYQFNTKKQVLILQTVATLSTCISYFFLGALSGFALNVVCVVRNITYYFQKSRTPSCYVSTAIFAVVMLVLGVMSWQGAISALIIVALIINTFFLSLGVPQLLRKSILFTSTLVLMYNIYFLSIGGISNEAIAIISSVIGIIRFKKEKNA